MNEIISFLLIYRFIKTSSGKEKGKYNEILKSNIGFGILILLILFFFIKTYVFTINYLKSNIYKIILWYLKRILYKKG